MKKICKECGIYKPETDFAKNQYGKDNRILRRPICKKCYSKKKSINPKDKREFEKNNPKPAIGERFKCPICHRDFKREHKNDVVLDHNHKTGAVRGYICGSCNASIGKFKEDINILKRAIEWLLGNLKS